MPVEIMYDVDNLEAHHRELLRGQERAVRSVLEKSGKSGRYSWIAFPRGDNIELDLLDADNHRVACVMPLDLTRNLGEFERLLWECCFQ